MILIYLAAGRGSRLSKYWRNKPKCLIKIKKKSLFERNIDFFNQFKKKIIITGYRSEILKTPSKKLGFRIIKNYKYLQTNMVYSLFLAKKYINDDVVVCYGDIIFNFKIIELLKSKYNVLPVYSKWFNYWKKRMKKNQILNDAEDLKIKNKNVVMIGQKIKNIFPKYQFTGIIKLNLKTYKKMSIIFKSKNSKIDMTTFLNHCIQNNKIIFKAKKYSSFWHEIDAKKDIIVANKSNEIK
tara:strand:+ start:1874 stop:2590 length:717 start_codon:yes stop_codon:yes gene_type:complete